MDSTASVIRLRTRHQAEVERYVAIMVPRAADAAELLQDVSVLNSSRELPCLRLHVVPDPDGESTIIGDAKGELTRTKPGA